MSTWTSCGKKQALYIVGTPKAHLKKFACELLDEADWSCVHDGVEVKLVDHPDGHGAYLLRTNCLNKYPQSLWRWYIQLTQTEEAFRCCKSDLGLRPVFHHNEARVQAHILVCFLSLVLWRSFEMWMQAC